MDENFDKWYLQYIDGIDLNNIEWISLYGNELYQFLYKNYLDDESLMFISDNKFKDNPFGMYYLSYKQPCEGKKYFLGVCKNYINKYTIICAMVYSENYILFTDQKNPITFLLTVEVNKYFRNKGLLNIMFDEFSKVINPYQHFLCTIESEQGRLSHVYDKLYNSLRKNGFDKSIYKHDLLDTYSDEYHDLICENEVHLKMK